MNPVDIATQVEALNQFMVDAVVTSRLEVKTSDEETALEFATLFTNLVTAAEEFLGVTYEKDMP